MSRNKVLAGSVSFSRTPSALSQNIPVPGLCRAVKSTGPRTALHERHPQYKTTGHLLFFLAIGIGIYSWGGLVVYESLGRAHEGHRLQGKD